MALCRAFQECGPDVRAALLRFEQLRLPPMRKIWDAANASLRWYENMDATLAALGPAEFALSYLTRTGRVTDAAAREQLRAGRMA